jgi:exodeoxyribonuclease-5
MIEFLYDSSPNAAFLLRGYAGTGKTTLVGALIRSARAMQIKTVLLAPTGRAAKVLSNYSHRQAFTIHKFIYLTTTDPSGNVRVVREPNRHSYTLFIVDEASMIGLSKQNIFAESLSANTASGFKNQRYAVNSLLDDLNEYVASGINCRLMLIGDSAQLPPVGEAESPALNSVFLRSALSLKIHEAELKEVVRQKNESQILTAATALRSRIEQLYDVDIVELPVFSEVMGSDLVRLDAADMMEVLNREYTERSEEDVVVICRTNKRANLFNQAIRNRVLFREGEINAGDYLMVVRNNYHWLGSDSDIGFIANGDIVEVLAIRNHEELYGFHFVDATIRFVDYPDAPTLDCKVMLETLHSESPSLTSDESHRLYDAIAEDYADLPKRAERHKAVQNNPYFNALQVKFAYAITCHKTQGGQWDTVIIEQGFLTDEMLNKEYLRWLYTALTRATRKVYLLNFEDRFFSGGLIGNS